MPNILEEICQAKQAYLQIQKQKVPESFLQELLATALPTRSFLQALQQKITAKQTALIAEIKKASPSKGIIRDPFYPILITEAYETGGATCLSVLTDKPYFQGDDTYLTAVRAHSKLPILRKDFILDPYQVWEARVIGADCILLIMAALSLEQAKELEAIAHHLNMDVLVEVHTEQELKQALELNSPLIGINNRDLKTLKIDLNTTLSLAKLIPSHKIIVCESGIHTSEDIDNIQAKGIYCFLVGESLMKQEDITLATQHLLRNSAFITR